MEPAASRDVENKNSLRFGGAFAAAMEPAVENKNSLRFGGAFAAAMEAAESRAVQ